MMRSKPVQITRSRPRRTARITMMEDGSIWSAPVGTRLEEYFKQAYPYLIPMTRPADAPPDETIIAAVVDGALRELTFPVNHDVQVRPVLLSHSDGQRIYRRALSFVLLVAARELFPDRKIRVDHSLPFGGFYCNFVSGEPFTPEELAQVKARMWEIVRADQPITRIPVPLDEASAIFEAQGDDDKIRLLESRRKNYLIVYELRGVYDYFYGYMVPSTGYLNVFDLTHDGSGFILHYPRRQKPTEIQPITALPKLRRVFRETGNWLDLLGVEDMGALNRAIKEGRARELILAAEALHERSFSDMADEIMARRPDVRLVLIAGPTSSGKTTGSKRLAVQLIAHGLRPYTLAMDNYFVNRADTPRDESGQLDYEHIDAVDVELFKEHLLALMEGQEVQLPRYNFRTGQREIGATARLTPEHILIIEGIHALNPRLVTHIPPERYFRVYVSCLTQLNIDRHNRVPTTDVRILRRIVRDYRTRGYTAVDTLSRWESVRQGEHRWILPYQEDADLMFNSALVYELPVLRPLVEPLLLQVEPASPYYIEAKRLLSFLGWVEPLHRTDLVPGNSLLREFIGDSVLDSYIPGQPDLNGPCASADQVTIRPAG